jgi:hypothetical protein
VHAHVHAHVHLHVLPRASIHQHMSPIRFIFSSLFPHGPFRTSRTKTQSRRIDPSLFSTRLESTWARLVGTTHVKPWRVHPSTLCFCSARSIYVSPGECMPTVHPLACGGLHNSRLSPAGSRHDRIQSLHQLLVQHRGTLTCSRPHPPVNGHARTHPSTATPAPTHTHSIRPTHSHRLACGDARRTAPCGQTEGE